MTEEKTEDTVLTTPTPQEESPESIVSGALAAAERIEAANKEMAALIKRQEALAVENTLGGSASAGGDQELSDEQKKDKDAKKFLAGTGYENTLFPDV